VPGEEMRAGCQPAGSTIFDRLSEETTNQPARLDDPSQVHTPKRITADRMASGRRVVRSDGYIRSFFHPPRPGAPILFCTIVTRLRVNFEVLSYSDQGISSAVEWVAGFVWARTWAVIIKEMDVSNGPADSTRHRNTLAKPISRHLVFQGFPGSLIQLSGHSIQLPLGVNR
jgi:hypothetical protein